MRTSTGRDTHFKGILTRKSGIGAGGARDRGSALALLLYRWRCRISPLSRSCPLLSGTVVEIGVK